MTTPQTHSGKPDPAPPQAPDMVPEPADELMSTADPVFVEAVTEASHSGIFRPGELRWFTFTVAAAVASMFIFFAFTEMYDSGMADEPPDGGALACPVDEQPVRHFGVFGHGLTDL